MLPIHKGGGTGRNSDQPGMNGDKNAMKLNFENGVTCVPYSKSNWLRAFGLRDPNLNNSSMNSAYTVGEQKRKGTSVNAKEERNGGDQVAVANTIAVLAGLYHYPGCDSNAANWIVEQTVKGKKYKLRMRVPNPNYKEDGGRLVSYEKATHRVEAKDVPDTTDNLGNSDGQKVRGILNTKRPITFHDLFLHKSMNTAKEKKLLTNVAPIFGDKSTTYGGDKIVRVRHNGVELRKRLIMKEIVPEPANVSDTNPGFVFGFAPSKSLWLYPYVYVGSSVKVVAGDWRKVKSVGYQAQPRPDKEFAKRYNKNGAPLGMSDLFEKPPIGWVMFEDMSAQDSVWLQGWVLGDTELSNVGPPPIRKAREGGEVEESDPEEEEESTGRGRKRKRARKRVQHQHQQHRQHQQHQHQRAGSKASGKGGSASWRN